VDRRRLSEVLAERWQWYAASGQLKDMAARTLLGKLEDRGLIVLPRVVARPPRVRIRVRTSLSACPLGSRRACPAAAAANPGGWPKEAEYRRFQSYLRKHHYLGHRGPWVRNWRI